jgi:TonB-dependent starch-binding outer membrane protein SusC
MHKVLLIVSLSLLQVTAALAQERIISGRVTAAEDGSELPGINVFEKGAVTGTVTDHHGRYSLTVKCGGGVLVFSFIGYITVERSIGGSTVIDIQLSDDAKQLSDTVVTGQENGIERCGG